MTPILLFRNSLAEENELNIAKKYFTTIEYRSQIPNKYIVIGRYSVLPYYKELEQDLLIQTNGTSFLINSFLQHSWIANFDYYEEVKQWTFETWFDYNFHQCQEGQFVVKGRTNSRKFNWNTMMFAKSKRDASLIACELKNDGLIGSQDIIYRKYIPLKNLGTGLNGLPFCNEWRFFYYKETCLSHGFYWTIADNKDKANSDGAKEFADMVAKTVSNFVDFFVLDVAEKEDGGWILVEINDGQMSGLSDNSPDILYSNLKKELSKE